MRRIEKERAQLFAHLPHVVPLAFDLGQFEGYFGGELVDVAPDLSLQGPRLLLHLDLAEDLPGHELLLDFLGAEVEEHIVLKGPLVVFDQLPRLQGVHHDSTRSFSEVAELAHQVLGLPWDH
eukprot:CAMPEP_0168616096 /NCGR_PEP_ID=MMETSP0449_2-20121227/4851_1 /TAXON_ID=1082188 /ORGANISM="Strombidium rassoulzadegani, Strain ras09" /LENGTH=121 /DNA_ID=CAMNT_0008656871 /DNA_START=907 /DNA_END=1272 /DNA_ORIENTATION=-